MNSNINWGDELTLANFNENLTDANKKGFFITPLQTALYKITDDTTDADKLIVANTIFTKSKIDAIKLINFYTFNRIQQLPNGWDSLNAHAKLYFTLALYKQIEFTQYNLGNVVEVQQSIQYAQGTTTNIAISPDSSIYASDKLCLEARNYIDFTGIRAIHKSTWKLLVSE